MAGVSAGSADRALAKTRRHPIVKSLRHNYDLYLLLPALAYLIIFKYAPMYGLQISFRDFNPVQGMWGSPWAGLKHFFRFFDSYMFVTVVRNTLALNLYQLLVGFPIPIMLALLLNQVPNQRFKKTVQTSIYAPHFISMVVMVGMLHLFLSPRSGLVNHAIGLLGAEPVYFFGKAGYFRSLYVWSDIWQNAGWGTIIYLAALSAVDPELHEAAIVDGATKLQRIRHIDIPGILPIAVILLILEMGRMMSIGFEKAYLMKNPLNADTAEIIATYVYEVGIENAQYSFSAAVGFFNSVINLILLITVNRVARRLSGTSLW